MTARDTLHPIVSSHMLASTTVSYPLGLWRPMTILVDICDARHIHPPDTLMVCEEAKSLFHAVRLSISRDSYACSVTTRNDTDTVDAPFFRSACHALLDAYESRAQGEEPTVYLCFSRSEGEKE